MSIFSWSSTEPTPEPTGDEQPEADETAFAEPEENVLVGPEGEDDAGDEETDTELTPPDAGTETETETEADGDTEQTENENPKLPPGLPLEGVPFETFAAEGGDEHGESHGEPGTPEGDADLDYDPMNPLGRLASGAVGYGKGPQQGQGDQPYLPPDPTPGSMRPVNLSRDPNTPPPNGQLAPTDGRTAGMEPKPKERIKFERAQQIVREEYDRLKLFPFRRPTDPPLISAASPEGPFTFQIGDLTHNFQPDITEEQLRKEIEETAKPYIQGSASTALSNSSGAPSTGSGTSGTPGDNDALVPRQDATGDVEEGESYKSTSATAGTPGDPATAPAPDGSSGGMTSGSVG